jgi:hypothetical protein
MRGIIQGIIVEDFIQPSGRFFIMTNGCDIPALFSIRVFFHGVTWSGLIGNRDDIQAEAERNAVSTEHPEGQRGCIRACFAGVTAKAPLSSS